MSIGSDYGLVVPDLARDLPRPSLSTKQPKDAGPDRHRVSTSPGGERAIHGADGVREIAQHLDLFRLWIDLERELVKEPLYLLMDALHVV